VGVKAEHGKVIADLLHHDKNGDHGEDPRENVQDHNPHHYSPFALKPEARQRVSRSTCEKHNYHYGDYRYFKGINHPFAEIQIGIGKQIPVVVYCKRRGNQPRSQKGAGGIKRSGNNPKKRDYREHNQRQRN